MSSIQLLSVLCLILAGLASLSSGQSGDFPILEREDDGRTVGELGFEDTGVFCDVANCTLLLEEIFRFVELGLKEIQLTNTSTTATIVVGLSGVGKSTLTQFFANETNPIKSVCEWGDDCRVVDENGIIGETVISKTLLPNLVIDKITNGQTTVFYDMPGFDDNRNESVEIANSFFIKHVIESYTEIKIVVVTKASDLQVSERNNFINLLIFLSKLVKDPAKFRSGISIIVNMCNYAVNDTNLYGRFRQFIKGINDSEEVNFGEYANSAREFLQVFLEGSESDAPSKLAVMRKPIDDGVLNDMPVFRNDRIPMKEMIWNSTRAISKNQEDFGYSISPKAQVVLMETKGVFINSVKNSMNKLADNVKEDLQRRCLDLAQGSGDQGTLEALLINLRSASYGYLNITSKPQEYILKILATVGTFAPSLVTDAIGEFNTTMIFLDYIHDALLGTNFQQHDWILGLLDIRNRLQTYITSVIGRELESKTRDAIRVFSTAASTALNQKLISISSGSNSDIASFKIILNALKTADYNECWRNSTSATRICLNKIKANMNLILPEDPAAQSGLQLIINFVAFCNVAVPMEISFHVDTIELETIFLNLQQIAHSNLSPSAIANIKASLKTFTDSAVLDFTRKFTALSASQFVDINQFNRSLISMASANYDICLNSRPLSCSTGIIPTITNINAELAIEANRKLNHSAWFLEFCLSDLETTQYYETSDWVLDLKNMNNSLRNSIINGNIHNPLHSIVYQRLDNETSKLRTAILHEVNKIDDMAQREEKLKEIDLLATAALNQIKEIVAANASVSETIILILSKYNGFLVGDENYIVDVTAIQLLEIMGNFPLQERWSDPFENRIAELVREEEKFVIFLQTLNDDLSSFGIQVQNPQLINWWDEGKGNISNLWTQLQKYDVASKHLLRSDEFDRLIMSSYSTTLRNSLLFTLKPQLCPTLSGGSMIFQGNYLSITHVLQCIRTSVAKPSTVAIIAPHTTFLDEDFAGIVLSPATNINLFLLSPTVDVRSSRIINLSGIDGNNGGLAGADGTAGKDAGNYYSVSEIQKGSNINYHTNGGNGGHGSTGTNGQNGNPGTVKVFRSESNYDDCAAWSGGAIQIRLLPNTCNLYTNYDGQGAGYSCHAGNDGRDILIDGTVGERGGNGGNGGNSGRGGRSGTGKVVDLNQPNAIVSLGKAGTNGQPGLGGRGGSGGRDGDQIFVNIDDCYCPMNTTEDNATKCPGKKCCEKNRQHRTSSKTAPSGSDGHAGQVQPLYPTKRSNQGVHNAETYIQLLKDSLRANEGNPFFGRSFRDTLQKLNNHPALP